jgi:hypothetical protein
MNDNLKTNAATAHAPMALHLRVQWILCACLLALLVAGTALNKISSATQEASLKLTVGETVTLTAYRLYAAPTRLELQFESKAGVSRPELGVWSTVDPVDKTSNVIKFTNPGALVKLNVSSGGRNVSYSAMPASGHSENQTSRDLIPWSEANREGQFAWPSKVEDRAVMGPGSSNITVTVQEVAPALTGETVSIWLQPPLGFKSSDTSYEFLWPFFFWPFFAFLLALYAGLLFLLTRRASKQRVSAR